MTVSPSIDVAAGDLAVPIQERGARALKARADGQHSEAARWARAVLAEQPGDFGAWMLLADSYLAAGAPAQALEAYERAGALNPGHAQPFTRAATLRFRLTYGMPRPPVPARPGPRVQFRRLGSDGRFGNQLLQYGFLRLYGARHGLHAECPDWIGRDLYDLTDPVPSGALPVVSEATSDLLGSLAGRNAQVYREVDVQGYFCGSMADWGPVADAFRSLFVLSPRLREPVLAALARLREGNRTVVAIHLRRGDFGYGRFWVAPVSWYLDWLRGLWPQLSNPVLFIATDDASVVPEFAAYSPQTAQSLGLDVAGVPFLVDHEVLRDADHVAISNSSFSFSAALLNRHARSVLRPDPDARRLRPCEPWQEPVLLDPAPASGHLDEGAAALIGGLLQAPRVIVRYGEPCAPAAHEFRARFPTAPLVELAVGESVDRWRTGSGKRQIDLLLLERATLIPALIEQYAALTLATARIDFLLVSTTPDDGAHLAALVRTGYAWFEPTPTGLRPADPVATDRARTLVAIHERLVPLVVGPRTEALDLNALCAAHGVSARGVAHVGAHEGQELPVYEALGAKRVVFVEANPVVHARLSARVAGRDHVIAVQRAASDAPGRVQLHLASFDQSSSLLPMDQHLAVYPGITPAGTVEVQATPLDDLLVELAVPATDISLLVVDVQGAELQVLQGATGLLGHVEAVQVEVSFASLYAGGAQIEEVHELLTRRGFERVALLSGWHPTWGDAFYRRRLPVAG